MTALCTIYAVKKIKKGTPATQFRQIIQTRLKAVILYMNRSGPFLAIRSRCQAKWLKKSLTSTPNSSTKRWVATECQFRILLVPLFHSMILPWAKLIVKDLLGGNQALLISNKKKTILRISHSHHPLINDKKALYGKSSSTRRLP